MFDSPRGASSAADSVRFERIEACANRQGSSSSCPDSTKGTAQLPEPFKQRHRMMNSMPLVVGWFSDVVRPWGSASSFSFCTGCGQFTLTRWKFASYSFPPFRAGCATVEFQPSLLVS
uniref:Uncharacterized protein n=1 Tax=Trichuris muris TaxID=70415 RepID=A0A5S6QPS4_TRIMR